MSELFMECEEEELEPWQIQAPKVDLADDDDDDDDELIFVGELSSSNSTMNGRAANNQSNGKKPLPVQTAPVGRPAANRMTITQPSNVQALNPPGTLGVVQSQPIVAGQPIIINNQGYFMSSPQQLSANTSTFITSLGKQYPPGTSFTIVPAGQPFLTQLASPNVSSTGVVHRPQVQQISKNVVTLSNVQGPAVTSPTSRPLPPPVQMVTQPMRTTATNKDNNPMKRSLPPEPTAVKWTKFDTASISDHSENGWKRRCPQCRAMFFQPDVLKSHMKGCCPQLIEAIMPSLSVIPTAQTPGKRLMLVKDFYYGRYEGDPHKQQGLKTNTTFKCQSCLKVLKNNIRFMNHMKHHLDLEKQNNESYASHTTCQHCYRQYTTPFQLQCHIENAHTQFGSSTNCKICELAFESEQVLLEHMKDTHKPGEMPYVCQVCNFRSSFFSEVEGHFRTVHENTKDLLCPFCLKALRTGHVYMQHYMKHQKKSVHRCTKCRLNFLSYKEKADHIMQFHKTFKKPAALEGLPPGTKVTIRASFTGPGPVSPTNPKYDVDASTAAHNYASQKYVKKTPVYPKPPKPQKALTEKKRGPKKSNIKALKNLRPVTGTHTCIECETQVDDFPSHYSCVITCGACKYSTSCKLSIGNHMIRFHSTYAKDKYRKMDQRKSQSILRGLTLICVTCDYRVDIAESDHMTKHLAEKPHHVCRIMRTTPASARWYPPAIQPPSLIDMRSLVSVEAEVHPIPSSVLTSPLQEARESPTSGDDIILIDEAGRAQQAAIPAIDLTEDEPATPPTGEELSEEQAASMPPPPSAAPLSDGGEESLDQSPSDLGPVSTDVSEQTSSPPGYHTAVASPGEISIGAVPVEMDSLVTETPPGDELPRPDGSGMEEDSMGPEPAEVSSPNTKSPAESLPTESPADPLHMEGGGIEDSMGAVESEVGTLITESPTEDLVPTDSPAEDIFSTENPGEDLVPTESPAEEIFSTENPAEDLVPVESPAEGLI